MKNAASCDKSGITNGYILRSALNLAAILVLLVAVVGAARAAVVATVTASNGPRTPSGNPIYVLFSTEHVTVSRTSSHTMTLRNTDTVNGVGANFTAVYHCGI